LPQNNFIGEAVIVASPAPTALFLGMFWAKFLFKKCFSITAFAAKCVDASPRPLFRNVWPSPHPLLLHSLRYGRNEIPIHCVEKQKISEE